MCRINEFFSIKTVYETSIERAVFVCGGSLLCDRLLGLRVVSAYRLFSAQTGSSRGPVPACNMVATRRGVRVLPPSKTSPEQPSDVQVRVKGDQRFKPLAGVGPGKGVVRRESKHFTWLLGRRGRLLKLRVHAIALSVVCKRPGSVVHVYKTNKK